MTGIFDHLNPDDFDARPESVYELEPAEDFTSFIGTHLRSARFAFAAVDGHLKPMATLSSATVERLYLPTDAETMEQFIARLNDEARILQARRLFVLRQTYVGTYTPAEHETGSISVDDLTALRRAASQTDNGLQHAVYWYAEEIEPQMTSRHGFMVIEGERRLGPVFEATPQINMFSDILLDVPR